MKRNVFNCLLKEAREVAVVTLVGRLFHARAAVTQKEQSPMVRSHVLGMISRCREPDRSCRSESALSVHWRSRRRYGGHHIVTAAENEYGQLKPYSFRNLQPVEVLEKMCDVVVLLRVTDRTRLSIKHGLQTVQQVTGKTSQSHTAIIKSRHDQWRDQWPMTIELVDWPVYG